MSTLVYLPPEEVYEFLLAFPGYANYSKYLQRVRQYGDGGPGTEYDLRFAWWKLTYTARSRVTDVDPPERIDWRVVKDIDAVGVWSVEADPDRARDPDGSACRVRFVVEYDPDSVEPGSISLPRFVSLGWVIERVTPLIVEEAERIVERVVADLEGESREVDLVVHETPG